MANILSELVVKIRGDASDLNESLKETFKQTKEATQGFQMLGRQLFKAGAILTAFAGGVLLLFKNAFDNFMASVGDPALESALTEWDALMNEISITIGAIFAPLLTDIIKGVTDIVESFKDNHPKLFNFALVFIAIGAAIVGFLGVLGLIGGAVTTGLTTLSGIVDAFKKIPDVVKMAQDTISTFSKELPKIIAKLHTELMLIAPELIAIAILIAAIYILWKTGFLNMEKVSSDFSTGTSDIFEGLSKILQGKQEGIMQVGIGIWETFFKTTLRINSAFQKAMNSVFSLGAKIIIGIIVDLINFVVGKITEGLNVIIDLANTISSGLGVPLNIARANFQAFSKIPMEEFFDKTTKATNDSIDALLELNDVMGEQFKQRTLNPETFRAAQEVNPAMIKNFGFASRGLAPAVAANTGFGVSSAQLFNQAKANKTTAINGDVNIEIETFVGDQTDKYINTIKDKIADLYANDTMNLTGYQPLYPNQ